MANLALSMNIYEFNGNLREELKRTRFGLRLFLILGGFY